ncbi:MAG: hypothetical protein C9356_17985, partial [Oleiphilus sp.]
WMVHKCGDFGYGTSTLLQHQSKEVVYSSYTLIIPDAPSAPKKLGGLTIAGALTVVFGFGGFILWALLTPLDSAVVAQGVIKVGSEKKQVQHLEGGIVKALHVREGDQVVQGQTLLTLDETFAGADYAILSTQIQELQIREALLRAQRDNLNVLEFPPHIQNGPADLWLSQQKESAEQFFRISQDNLDSQLSVIAAQIEQIDSNVAGYQREIAAKNEQLSYMEEEAASWRNLMENKYANKLRYLELQGENSELKSEIEQLKTRTQSSAKQVQELGFEKVRISQSYREAAANELIEVQLNIRDLSKRMDSASNVLSRIELKAPVDGKVVGLSVHTIGAVIRPGDTILEIVPDKDELVIGAKVMPIDIDKVHRQMDARIRLSSYKQHEFPEFNGVVDWVSADVFQDPQSLEGYYTVRITIPHDALPGISADQISPGMPAEVMIVTGQSTPAQYLVDPLLTAFRSAWRDS